MVLQQPYDKIIHLVEVKSLSQSLWSPYRISQFQKNRLEKVLHYFVEKYPQSSIQLQLVFVDRNDGIQIINWRDL